MAAPKKFVRERFEELLKKRFFFAPSFSIYGGVTGLFDYGPPGCAIQANILDLWRSHFILEEQMLEVDTTVLTTEDVLKTSGHVDRFTDLMVMDVENGRFFRADHLLKDWLKMQLKQKEMTADKIEEYELILAKLDGFNQTEMGEYLKKYDIRAPESKNELTDPVPFNLMFDTQIGPTGSLKGYLRPETAQGQFVNFKRLYECNNERMPFASAQIGRAFRNEISPRQGLLRVREFTMAEIEHYVHPLKKNHERFSEVEDMVLPLLPSNLQEQGIAMPVKKTIKDAVSTGMVNNETLGYFLGRIYLFLIKIGIKPERLRFRQHMSNEMAHYACDCWDAEIESSYGWIECVGCADRSAFDLTNHTKRTGEKLVAREKLDEAVAKTYWKAELNRKEIGIAFKKEASKVADSFQNLTECELQSMADELQANGKIIVNGFEVLSKMVKISQVTDIVHVDEYIPSVIEPSFGIGRILYSLLEHAYWTRDGDDQRAVLSLPPVVAPTKCLVVPLSNNSAFVPFIRELRSILRKFNVSFQVDDSSGSIGRRYSRNDEIGTPFGITVDFQTVQDKTVTLRERDSTCQVRIPIEKIGSVISSLSVGDILWSNVATEYPEFSQQQVE